MSDKTDHDLLVEINQKVTSILETSEDHESRIRTLERNLWLGVGAIMLAGAAMKFLWK